GAAMGNLSLALPRLFLDYQTSLEAVGVFTSIFFIFQAGNMVFQTISQLMATRLAKLVRTDARRWAREACALTVLFLLLSCAVILFVAVFGEWVLLLFYGAEVAVFSSLFMLLALGWGVRYVAISLKTAVTSLREFRLLLGFEILAALTTTLVLIRGMGGHDPLARVTTDFGIAQGFYFFYSLVLFFWVSRKAFAARLR
ncbi:MAG TPA: hypothetical protein DDZ43_11410, partial [Hyphomonadaceae bacterium]|nr:hypothetical protein [Hyphomonadaceae bacterium]